MAGFQRWHIGKDGKPGRCTASKRACPYASHFDTQEDAYSVRETIYSSAKTGEFIKFEHALAVKSSGIENVPEEPNAASIRDTSRRALIKLQETGERLKFPGGKVDVDFGGGHRFIAKRETFTWGREPRTRWMLTAFSTPNNYETTEVILHPGDRDGYKIIQETLQSSVNAARDARISRLKEIGFEKGFKVDPENADPDYDRNLKQVYDNSLQLIEQVEIMANGADNALKDYGIDLFSKDNPRRLDLNLDLNRSAIQVHDIVDSLKIHAMEDSIKKDITIDVNEVLPSSGNSWSLTRIPEGNWYFSHTINEEMTSKEINPNDPDHPDIAKKFVQELYAYSREDATQSEVQSAFVHRVMTEIEPAIRNYERAIEARLSSSRVKMTTSATSKEKPQKTMKDKLFSIFG